MLPVGHFFSIAMRALPQPRPWVIYPILILLLGMLVALSPAESTLGSVVKLVYLHGAMERVAVFGFLLAGVFGLVHFFSQRQVLARWAQASLETGLVFWLAQFIVSLPAQVLAWGAISWDEPRVVGALWIMALSGLTYAVARWIGGARWMSCAAIASAVIVTAVLRGEVNVVHPPNAILASDSLAIKFFYAAIVLSTGLVALQFAFDRTNSRDSRV